MKNSNKNEMLIGLSKPLSIDQVDFRIQSINKGGYATILAYKDARVDMNRLDEVCGANWQDKYELIDGQLFCSIAIKIDGEWIWRQDVGTESMTEKTKGRASDAFKRAGFRWGIGRELYDYPLIQVKLNQNEFKIIPASGNYKEKVQATWDLKLKEWKWSAEFIKSENGPEKLKRLSAVDNHGKTRFDSLGDSKEKAPVQNPTSAPQKNTSTKEKPWLNITDNNKKFTVQWKNVTDGVNNGIIKNVSQVREHYKVSKEVEAKITELLNYQMA